MEGPGGSKVYTHVRWANGLTAHVREAEDSSGFVLGEVFKDLPCPVKDLIRHKKQTTYKELADSVLAIDIGDLWDSMADYRRDEETARLARAPPSPTKAVCNMLSATHIQGPQRTHRPIPIDQRMTQPTNLFMNISGRGNLFPVMVQHQHLVKWAIAAHGMYESIQV